ncbi:MAG: helix-turn-helix domain-containing protein [Cyanobacteria bacterium SBLK]|nr:helix-turn-helix domain-containing protein [Cyanobacteria bacterium SBLK]
MTKWQPQQIDRLQLIGTILQFHRDDRSLDRFATQLQIDPAVLLALEAGRVEILPTPQQTRLIIQHYARVLGVEYLKLADSLPLASSEELASGNPTKKLNALPRMPKRSRRRYRWLLSRRRWKRLFARPIWKRFSLRLSTLVKFAHPQNLKRLREQGKLLQLWMGAIVLLGACLGIIVAIFHLIFILFSPEGRLLWQQNPREIFWLGMFEFLKVFVCFVVFFALLSWLGSKGRSRQ